MRAKLRLILATLALPGAVAVSLASCGGGPGERASDAEEQLRIARKLYDEKKYFRSAEEFQKVIYNFPGSNLVDTAQYYLSLSYMDDEQFELAAVEFDRLIKNYPRSPYAVESRYRIGYCFFRSAPRHYGLDQTELKRAMRLLEDFVLDFPESEFVPEARESLMYARNRLAQKDYKAAMVYVHMRAYASAELYFQRVLDEYGGTEFGRESLYEMARIQYKMERWDKAAQAANTYIALYPESERIEKVRKLLLKIEKDRPPRQAPTATGDSENRSPAASSSADADS
ncbi:MAG: outer membrane protein assembly factor BamD [Candidatus Zixiibacteriota bacterium]